FFKVVKVTVYNWIVQDITDELPLGHHGLVTHHLEMEEVATSDGLTPLHVLKGQAVVVEVQARVTQHSIPPGPFSGTLLLQGQSMSRTVNLSGTYLAVNENSPIGQKWKQMGGEQFFGQVLTNEAPTPDGRAIIQEF